MTAGIRDIVGATMGKTAGARLSTASKVAPIGTFLLGAYRFSQGGELAEKNRTIARQQIELDEQKYRNTRLVDALTEMNNEANKRARRLPDPKELSNPKEKMEPLSVRMDLDPDSSVSSFKKAEYVKAFKDQSLVKKY